MKHDGVIQPIVVRPHPKKKGQFEIRAGERRWRAAKLAGLSHMPAIIRPLQDEAALSVTLAENLQRLDPHPLEEAATMQQAFDRGYDVKALSARLGKSVKFLARRASLTRLCKVWTDAVLSADHPAGRLSIAHLELVSRLPEETQLLLAADDFHAVFGRGSPTVDDLQRVIDGGIHTLRTMPWKIDDETLDPTAGSCVNCPKRSGCQPMLFDDEEPSPNGSVSKTDRCLDPQCYDRKLVTHLQRCESSLRTEHPDLRLVQIGYDRISPSVQDAFEGKTTRVYGAKFVKPSDKRGTPVMQIDGPKAGQLVHIRLADHDEQLNGSGRKQRPRDAQGKPIPMSFVERKARLQKRRDAFIVKQVAERLRAYTLQEITDLVKALPPFANKQAGTLNIESLVMAFGTSQRADRPHYGQETWIAYDGFRDLNVEARRSASLEDVIAIWLRRLSSTDNSVVNAQAHDAKRICELLGWDHATIEMEAASAIPEPKSWAALQPHDQDSTSSQPDEHGDTRPSTKPDARKGRRRRREHHTGRLRPRRKRRAA